MMKPKIIKNVVPRSRIYLLENDSSIFALRPEIFAQVGSVIMTNQHCLVQSNLSPDDFRIKMMFLVENDQYLNRAQKIKAKHTLERLIYL